MSLQRTPTKGSSKLISPTQFGSDPALYTPESQQHIDLNVTKRNKRRFDDDPSTVDITLSDLLAKIDELKNQQDHKFTSLETAMKDLTNQNSDIKESMMLLSEKYDDVLSNLKSIQQENSALKSHIKTLETKLDQFEKKSRSTMIEIRNVPVTEIENKDNLVEVAKKIGTIINVPILDSDIRDVYRVKSKDKPSGPIVVDFTSTIKREKFISATGTYNKSNREKRLNSTNLNLAGPEKPIYVAESLTASVRRLHYQARLFAKKHNFEHCWTSFGKVYLKRKDNQPRLRINCEEDLTILEKSI